MGQRDVYEFLKLKQIESTEFLDVPTIIEGMKQKGFSNGTLKGVANDLFKLTSCGFVECRGVGLWSHKKTFRAKKE
jgi:hypothetical protein